MGGDRAPGAVPDAERLLGILENAKEKGFLGPGDLSAHLRHAEGLARIVEETLGSAGGPEELCDLGSGGGIPGLVMACRWPETCCTLIEVGHRRCEALREALEVLGVGDRVRVVEGRAEETAREADLREGFPVLVARSFGRPAVTAEIAAGLVAVGGILVVSDPPGRRGRAAVAPGGTGAARIRAGPGHGLRGRDGGRSGEGEQDRRSLAPSRRRPCQAPALVVASSEFSRETLDQGCAARQLGQGSRSTWNMQVRSDRNAAVGRERMARWISTPLEAGEVVGSSGGARVPMRGRSSPRRRTQSPATVKCTLWRRRTSSSPRRWTRRYRPSPNRWSRWSGMPGETDLRTRR
ncbi:MAG: class I SAM-dependent methyltransferase [Acidimicrobiia bacterium]|nr:class I SAM-dependent methyltransferase [Acidimicrobiia bacterium]